MWILPDSRVFSFPRDFILNGKSHKKNIFYNQDTLSELGIKQFQEKKFDERYYRSSGSEDSENDRGVVVRTHTVIPKMEISELKNLLIVNVKNQAGSLLAPTDWCVIRAAEPDGVSIPDSALTYRQSVRDASNSIEDKINVFSDYDLLVEFNWNSLWPEL
uniref:Uncharacterized protein n=1 Tax=viral metagenome TaxID=1070528 RepID=A0A6M3IMB9_9ZZZZ